MQLIEVASVILFLGLAIFHFFKSRQKISHFQNKGVVKSMNGLLIGVGELISDFNSYIDNVNNENRTINLIAVATYVLAAITTILGFISTN